jgi:hypothetical protein
MRKILFVGLMVASMICAQDQSWLSSGVVNGRGWKACDEKFKIGYLIGLYEAFATTVSAADYANYYHSKLSFSEIAKGIDKFYEESENALVPVIGARAYVISKAAGVSAPALQKKLEELRQIGNADEASVEETKPAVRYQ